MTYVFLFFIPGAAGNFLSRCLNLLDGACCWSDNGYIPVTLEEKLQLLNYKSVLGRSDAGPNWVLEWEKRVSQYRYCGPAVDTIKIAIWPGHPADGLLKKKLIGKDDRTLTIYIDPSDAFEWATLNALYKISYIDVDWLKVGAKMIEDSSIYKISLADIIRDEESFVLEILRICIRIGHALTENEKSAIVELYRHWKTTTLAPSQFAEFKQKIGWQL